MADFVVSYPGRPDAMSPGWLAFRHPAFDWRGKYANLARHYDKLSERPAFAETAPA